MIATQKKGSRMPRVVQIETIRYVAPYRLQIHFDDGHESLVDFGTFLRTSRHPSIKAYLNVRKFKDYTLEDGMLHWNDFDLVFPMADLYNGRIR